MFELQGGSKKDGDLASWLPCLMERMGNTVLRRIAHREHGDQVIGSHVGEGGLQACGIKVSDPCGAKAEVVDGKHHMRGGNGSVHIGKIAVVIGPLPGGGGICADNENHGRVKMEMRGFPRFFQGFGTFNHPDPEGLAIDGRRSGKCGLQDAVQLFPFDFSV
ncbi:MAG: hypothetical protein IJ865_06895 [Clostridia bacterium]|nr:hypothetical protein [Clostridia bacterium]